MLAVTTKRRMDQLQAVRDTWASDCDGVMFVSDRRLPLNFPSFVPALAAEGGSHSMAHSRFDALKLALSRAPFSQERFDFYLLAPDSVFVVMCNLRLLLARASAARPLAWGLVARSYVPGAGRVARLAGRAGVLLSDAARLQLASSDCSWPHQTPDSQLSLCLHGLGVPQRHVSGFHATSAVSCATAPPPPPPSGLVERVRRWIRGPSRPRHWRPCPPRAVTFGEMNFTAIRRAYFMMNLGIYGRTGKIDSRPNG